MKEKIHGAWLVLTGRAVAIECSAVTAVDIVFDHYEGWRTTIRVDGYVPPDALMNRERDGEVLQ